MNKEIPQMKRACHCGKVQFAVTLSDGLSTARRCTCSYCRMRGAIAVSAELHGVTITTGNDTLGMYQFNSGAAKHYFCSNYGIYTHHHRRSNPNQYGVNAACLEGIGPFDFDAVPVLDGENNPSDTGVTRTVGVLHFDRSPPT